MSTPKLRDSQAPKLGKRISKKKGGRYLLYLPDSHCFLCPDNRTCFVKVGVESPCLRESSPLVHSKKVEA